MSSKASRARQPKTSSKWVVTRVSTARVQEADLGTTGSASFFVRETPPRLTLWLETTLI